MPPISSDRSGDRSRPYHHGDLRAALLRAAEAALQAEPERNPSVRGLAQALGVSATAPLAHFPTKQALLTALATRGFDTLTAALDAETAETGASRRDRLAALARAYLGFGAAHPGLYRLMFRTGQDRIEDPALAAAAAEAFARLHRAAGSKDTALAAWALVHGLVGLRSDGKLESVMDAPAQTQALAQLAASHIAADD
ncbi:MAG: TetR/AcrR family transcriptional regulator [Rhodothalassiaceae bacterium]